MMPRMSLLSVFLIAIALAMDAFAVSISSGITIPRMKIRYALLIASSFGVFQAGMPVIGWRAGLSIRDIVACCDHWIAFGLLLAVAVKMTYEAFQPEETRNFDPLNLRVLLVLSVATSIDALAVGLTFSFVDMTIICPVIIIGLVTFALSFIGAYAGQVFGQFLKKKVEIAAALILIAIGVKIVLEHTLGLEIPLLSCPLKP